MSSGPGVQTVTERVGSDQLVRSLSLVIFLQWLGASAILPLLPLYLRSQGGSDQMVGAVMAAYFVAAVVFQYPAGYLADRIGRRTVLLGGLLVYAGASLAFVGDLGPGADIALRGLQGCGAGAVEVAALAMIASTVPLERRGRAFGSIYRGQLGGMAIGPLVGSLIGVGSMSVIFVGAATTSLVACLAVSRGSWLPGYVERAAVRTAAANPSIPPAEPRRHRFADRRRRGRPHHRRV